MQSAQWVEAKEQVTATGIRFWFDILDSDGWILSEPDVRIESTDDGSRAEIRFSSFTAPLKAQVRAEFYALKQQLTADYGGTVATRDEP